MPETAAVVAIGGLIVVAVLWGLLWLLDQASEPPETNNETPGRDRGP